jgi:hypothetical protein
MLNTNPMHREYSIAFAREDGSWDIVETVFVQDSSRISTAAANRRANQVAQEAYDGLEWYVLDAQGNNINGQTEHGAASGDNQ